MSDLIINILFHAYLNCVRSCNAIQDLNTIGVSIDEPNDYCTWRPETSIYELNMEG